MVARPVAERFYGMRLDPLVHGAAHERLTDQHTDDLVSAHLAANYSYFGAIDKTLAGFVVLDDEGDNYTLCDARGDGSIWWQDHETRDVYRHFADIEEWLAFRAEIKAGVDEDEARAMVAGSRPPTVSTADGQGGPSSAVLLDRYQWLVWLLAQPLRDRDGSATQTDAELARSAAGHLRQCWPTDAVAAEALDRELPLLAADPQLAVYWLLHTALLGQHASRARVLDALDEPDEPDETGSAGHPELVPAFAEVFGTLGLDGDFPLVPGFRARRAMLLLAAGADDGMPTAALTGLIIDPRAAPLTMAAWVIHGLDEGELVDADVAAALAGADAATGESVGVAAVLAVLDRRARVAHSPYADTVAATIAAGGAHLPGPGDAADAWVLTSSLLHEVHRLVGDLEALAGAARFVLDHDPYHRCALIVALHAIDRSAEQDRTTLGPLPLPSRQTLNRVMELGAASAPLVKALRDQREDEGRLMAEVAELEDPQLRQVVAYRVLCRIDLFEGRSELAGWAIRGLLTGGTAAAPVPAAAGELALGRPVVDLAVWALTGMRPYVAEKVLADVAAGVQTATDPVVGLLLRTLERPGPPDADFVAYLSAEKINKGCLLALAPYAHTTEVFDVLMALAERPADRTVLDPLWGTLFDPDKAGGVDVTAALSHGQVERVAAALVSNHLRHPSIHVRNAAHHRLYRFAPAGAERYLIGALGEYCERYAASTPDGGPVLDHGQTEDDVLENLVSALYSAVTRLGTPASRTALVQRLFTERRESWRMGNAIGDAFGSGIHPEAMAALRRCHDGAAAGCYAYALSTFVKQDLPTVELLRELVGWPVPDTDLARRFFRYAVHVGMAAALRTRDYGLVRAAHALASSIAEPPLAPDEQARRIAWTDPLTTDLRADLAAALSGAADTRRERLLAKGVAARAAGRPRRKITDDSLGVLTRTTVIGRLLHDRDSGEVWFLDSGGGGHAFDGYEIVPAPFTVSTVGFGDIAEFLAGVRSLSERTLLWSRNGRRFAELVRYGDRILVRDGVNNGSMDRVGLRFPDEPTAVTALTRLVGHQQARGLVVSDPWYLRGRGAVGRTFYTPEPGGGYSSERQWLSVFDGRFIRGGEHFDSDEDAARAHEEWVLAAERDRNATCLEVEWHERMRRPQDCTVQEWIKDRIRDDSRDAVWHVRALTEVLNLLGESGYRVAPSAVAVGVGTGVGEEEIAAFEAQRTHPVPQVLRDFWLAVGDAWWTGPDGSGLRVLSPTEVIAHRPAARALGERYLAALSPGAAEQARESVLSLDVLLATDAGAPVTLLADADPAVDAADGVGGVNSGRVFAHVDADPGNLWWERSLSWMLATGFLDGFASVVTALEPRTAQLNVGEAVNPDAVVRRFEKPATGGKSAARTRCCEVLHDPAIGLVSVRSGLAGATGAVRNHRFADPAKAARKVGRLVGKRLSDGYVEINTTGGPPGE